MEKSLIPGLWSGGRDPTKENIRDLEKNAPKVLIIVCFNKDWKKFQNSHCAVIFGVPLAQVSLGNFSTKWKPFEQMNICWCTSVTKLQKVQKITCLFKHSQ